MGQAKIIPLKNYEKKISVHAFRVVAIAQLLLFTGCVEILSPNGQFSNLQVGQGHNGNPESTNPVTDPTGTTAPTGPTTVSNWMGMNIDGDLLYNDLGHQLASFSLPPPATASLDANGFPVAGTNGTSTSDLGFIVPTGLYNISYVGTGTVTIGGIGVLTGPWQTVGNEQRNVISMTHASNDVNDPSTNNGMSFGHVLQISITNNPGQSVTDLHIFLPGVAYDTTELFYANVPKLLKPFRQLRFMSVEKVIGSSVVNWSDANVNSAVWGSNFTWQAIVTLINETGKDAWINIPALASDSFVTALGSFLLNNLNMAQINQLRAQQGYTTPFKIFVEYSNEVWAPANSSATDGYTHLLSIANSNPARYDGAYSNTFGPSWTWGSDFLKVQQVHADRIIAITTSLRKQFSAVGLPDCIAPVLGSWAVGAAIGGAALEFIKKNYPNPVSSYISYLAIAPYFGFDDSQSNDLSNLFLSIGDGTNPNDGISAATSNYGDFKKLVTMYGIQMAAYEGGGGAGGENNVDTKRLAQVEIRMYLAYKAYFKIWTDTFGTHSPFNSFQLSDSIMNMPPSFMTFGFWENINSILQDPAVCSKQIPDLRLGGAEVWQNSYYNSCAKYAAIMDL